MLQVYDELWSDVHELETVTLHEDPATHVIRVSHCVPALEQNWTISAVKHSGVVLSFVTQGGHRFTLFCSCVFIFQ